MQVELLAIAVGGEAGGSDRDSVSKLGQSKTKSSRENISKLIICIFAGITIANDITVGWSIVASASAFASSQMAIAN